MHQSTLPVRTHLDELRRRLFITVVTVIITTVVSFIFHQQIIRLLLIPANEISALDSGALVFIELTEMFTVSVKVSLVTGLIFAMPMILYQTIMFVSPGLTFSEKRYLFLFLPVAVIAFGGGIAFGYFIVVPPAIGFLIKFGGDLASPMIRIANYINLLVTLLFWIGAIFETPLIMLILARLGIVSPNLFARWRRVWVVVAFILAALITPTFDPLNQSLVAIPLIILYEVGILLAKFASRGRK